MLPPLQSPGWCSLSYPQFSNGAALSAVARLESAWQVARSPRRSLALMEQQAALCELHGNAPVSLPLTACKDFSTRVNERLAA